MRKTLLSTKNTHIGPAKLRDDKSRCVRTLSRLSTAFEVYWKEKKKIKGKKKTFWSSATEVKHQQEFNRKGNPRLF